ncbi:MAG: lysophospholipid transporter LplT, partial [Mariprofundaceae bacterium]|nr:lysophospholipid transporter LplT [Mariprofundaceae bacterium]
MKHQSSPHTMTADLGKLLTAQFLTALADNAILFIAVAMVMQGILQGDWYVSALQGCFLVAFVILAPWVGVFADTRSKPQVLMLANLIKAAGAGIMLLGGHPLLAYAIVGAGAAMYSPAKYGILPELVNGDDALMKANSWVEGSTIVAILLGMTLGAMVADYSMKMAMVGVFVIYFISAGVASWMQALPAAHDRRGVNDDVWKSFKSTITTLLATPRARFATLGVSLFWAAAVVLRLLIIAWAPVVLLLTSSTDISLLTLFIALGIAVGALLAPRLIPMMYLRRARWAAYGLGISILCLVFVADVWTARFVLFIAGICGGLFVVPINAALQDIGHATVGSGHAV